MDNSFFNKKLEKFHKKFKTNKSNKSYSLNKAEKQLVQNLQNARDNFDDADENSIDLAIYELMVAEERLNLLIKNKKEKLD